MSVVGRQLPERALAWAAGLAPYPVVDVTAMGGYTNTKWTLHLAEGDPLVIRWSDPVEWGATGREHVRREALACRLLRASALPVPQLVADDPAGASAGGPANLLTWRPGGIRLEPLGPAAVEALARLAVALHQQPVPTDSRPPSSRRGPVEPEVPGWARWPGLWRQAIELWAAGPPATPSGLLHGDFHLSNLLWQGDTVTGLVDWAELSWGPPDLDVAHLCSDLAMLHTTAAAQAFRAYYLRQGGRLDPDPDAAQSWIVRDILGFLPEPAHILVAVGSRRPDLSPAAVRHGLEDLLALTLGGRP